MKRHGEVDKHFSQQQFCKSDAITFIAWKAGALAMVKLGLDRQAVGQTKLL